MKIECNSLYKKVLSSRARPFLAFLPCSACRLFAAILAFMYLSFDIKN